MTFVPPALAKDTTRFYTAGCRETTWRTLLCLRNAPTFRSKPRRANHCKTTPSLKKCEQKRGTSLKTFSWLSSKKSRTENIRTNNLCQSLLFTNTWTRQGKTEYTHVRVISADIETTKTSTIKTCFSAIR